MEKSLQNLIRLLEDPDNEVFSLVSQKLSEMGTEVIPLLEKAWESSENQIFQEKIESVIHNIQFSYVLKEMENWVSSGGSNLLYGVFLVARYQYPELYVSEIDEQLEIIRRDAWVEMHDHLTALEKVRVLNHVLFAIHKFGRNSSNFYSPRNSFINQVLETKKGNPIAISVIYSLVAQKLGLPIYGVNLPLNYILAYQDPEYLDDPNGILFYINPYNRGTVLSKSHIDKFLFQQNLPARKEFYVPCSNAGTVSRILRNLSFSYEKMGYTDKQMEVDKMLSLFKGLESQIL